MQIQQNFINFPCLLDLPAFVKTYLEPGKSSSINAKSNIHASLTEKKTLKKDVLP